MANLLYLETSPRKERSASIAVAGEFLDAYRQAHPGDEVETLDLWALDLPPFDGDTIAAKYAILHGREHDAAQRAAWAGVTALGERFKAADKYLFSVPMWNFGLPYPLKHYIDLITQPGLTFSFSPEKGYQGLVTGRPAALIISRGGAYPADSPADFQRPYLESWLKFIGFGAITAIPVEPTLAGGPDGAKKARAEAAARARALAKDF